LASIFKTRMTTYTYVNFPFCESARCLNIDQQQSSHVYSFSCLFIHLECNTDDYMPTLVRNLILPKLDHVVRFAAQTLRAIVNDAQHVLRGFTVRRIRLEPIAQHLDCTTAETRQSGVKHQRNQRHNRFTIRPA